MKKLFPFLLPIFLLAFSHNIEAFPDPGPASPFPEPRIVLIPDMVRPGEPLTVGYSDSFGAKGTAKRNFQAVILDSRGRRLGKADFFDLDREEGEPEIKVALLAIPSTAAVGNTLLRIESPGMVMRELTFTVHPRSFESETIPLNQANTDIRTAPDPQKTAEAELLWAIISRTGTEIYSGEKFEFPINSNRRTSHYGDRRVYLYADGRRDTSIHAGIDLGVPTGTEVRACAKGKVVLARNRIVTGYTVILEHLPGVYSLYYHMDKIAVKEGSIVESGFPLGESGSTGLSTGPHLHWEIRVATENTDPDAFLARPILDKNEILNKIRDTETMN